MERVWGQTFRKKRPTGRGFFLTLPEETEYLPFKSITSMAKTEGWLYGSRGRLAGAYIRKDPYRGYVISEITRQKDRKSESQLRQRMFMATVIGAYKYMKAVCSCSFEGLAPGFPSMCQFKRLNLHMLRQRVAVAEANGGSFSDAGPFTPLGCQRLVPQPYCVSQGTLPGVGVVLSDADPGRVRIPAVADNSYGALIDGYGLLRGDRLWLITLQGAAPDRLQCHIGCIVLDPCYADGLQAPLSVPFVGADGRINLPSPLNEGPCVRFDFREGTLSYGYETGTVAAAGIVVTRRGGSTAMHSTCQLTVRGATGG